MKKENRKIDLYDVFVVSTMILAVLILVFSLLTPLWLWIDNGHVFSNAVLNSVWICGFIVSVFVFWLVVILFYLLFVWWGNWQAYR